MQIHVKTSADKTITLNVEATDTVESVKAKIRDEEGTPPERQALMLKGKHLDEQIALSGYDIRDGTTLTMVMKVVQYVVVRSREYIVVGANQSSEKTCSKKNR